LAAQRDGLAQSARNTPTGANRRISSCGRSCAGGTPPEDRGQISISWTLFEPGERFVATYCASRIHVKRTLRIATVEVAFGGGRSCARLPPACQSNSCALDGSLRRSKGDTEQAEGPIPCFPPACRCTGDAIDQYRRVAVRSCRLPSKLKRSSGCRWSRSDAAFHRNLVLSSGLVAKWS
jgi:hypothetical protein